MDSQEIPGIVTDISNIFGLQEQAKQLVALLVKAVKCKVVCLLFLNNPGDSYSVAACKPVLKNNPFSSFCPGSESPLIGYLLEERKPVTGKDIKSVSSLKKQLGEGAGLLNPEEIGLIVPLISSDKLVGMVILGQNHYGEYTPDEVQLLNDIAGCAAPGMEKEYLRERLSERENELSIISRCGAIITSSLDIESVYEKFATELGRMVDIDWTALGLVIEDTLHIMGLYSKIGSNWQAGDSIPVKGTATEWVTASKMPLVEPDLKKESAFVADVYHSKQGLRSIACIPLLVRDHEGIGSLIIGVRRPDAYSQKQVGFLQEVAAQIAKPVENAWMYAEVLQKSRYDGLTGLLNRRTMDEQIASEINRHSRYGGVFSLIIFDLDSLKGINDNYGHLAGDGLLARTGTIIKESVRSVDQSFRYGGDEFAILLPNTPINAAVRVADRVRKQIAQRLVVDDTVITASFGLSSWPINGPEATDIVGTADEALYEAKRLGGNRIYYEENSN